MPERFDLKGTAVTKKNASFAADLAAGIAAPTQEAAPASRRSGIGTNVLTGRENRLAELASGSVVTRTHELVDPARCRMWSGHNREYALLSYERCADLIESIRSQGKQEIPAIVRRVRGSTEHDFEVICGARRHWSISWLRQHNYPEFRFLVDIRELTDEEAFRLADLENRARDDLTDVERARDYLRALDAYYEGRQNVMAERLKVSASWLSRYLDLARLPSELLIAFPKPHDLKIKHVTALKPLLKPEESRKRVFEAATKLRTAAEEGAADLSVPDIIRALAAASVEAPKKQAGKPGAAAPIVSPTSGKPLFRIDGAGRKGVTLTLLPKGGGTRQEIENALREFLDHHWK